MQTNTGTRSNRERTESTRHALIAAARSLFVEKGYAETSTPEIVAVAGITRGALYHHFADKRDLLRAVLEQEARAVAQMIDTATPQELPAREALLAGAAAYLEAMRTPGRTRLLLIEGPAVLGLAEMRALDEANAERTLQAGLQETMREAGADASQLAALASLLSAAFDRAALAIDAGAEPATFQAAMAVLIDRTIGATR